MKQQWEEVAESIASLCCHVSVREDESGPLLLAFGSKDTHSLELRKCGERFVLELWHGKTAEEECVVEELTFRSLEEACDKAKEWLLKDAVSSGHESL